MTVLDEGKRAGAGVAPRQRGETMIRETWPGVADVPAVATLAQALMQKTYVLAPLAWLMLAPCYFKKVLPFIAKRYTLTNRRVMIRRGLKPAPSHEVALNEIDDVRIKEGSLNGFYRTATLQVISKGQVALELTAVKDPESFRLAILNAKNAWGKVAAAANGPVENKV